MGGGGGVGGGVGIGATVAHIPQARYIVEATLSVGKMKSIIVYLFDRDNNLKFDATNKLHCKQQ